MITIPRVLSEDLSNYNGELLSNEGRFQSRAHALPRTLAEWKRRREEIKAKIWELAGVRHDPSVDLDAKFLKKERCDGYTVQAVHYQTRPGIRATASLYVPDGDGPFPAVLNVHGHSSPGRRLCYIQARARMLARSGYVCLSVDTWGMGERSTEHEQFEYHGAMLGGGVFLLGETLLGCLLVDNMRSVDFLCSLPFVDASRLGVMGESGGGNQTMWVGAMDERLKAVLPVVSVGSFESYIGRSNCYCEVLPGAFREFEEDSVLALVAPRGLRMLNALQDSNPTFYVTEMMRMYRRAKEVFALYGAEQDISFAPFDTTHGFHPEMRESALGFMDYYLKGKGNGAARGEPSYATGEFHSLSAFAPGERPAGFGTISDHCTARFAALRARGPARRGDLAGEQAALSQILRLRPGDAELREATCLGAAGTPETKVTYRDMPPGGDRIAYREGVFEIGAAGASFTRWLIRDANGLAVPCLVRPAAVPGAVAHVLATPRGKQALAESARLSALLADPAACIVLVDLFATGENGYCELEPYLPPFHTVVRALMWLDRSLLGAWSSCYRLAAAFARTRLDASGVVFFGCGEAGVAAMAAAVLERDDAAPGAVAFEGEDVPESFAWAEGEKRPAPWRTHVELLRGFAEWGDVARIRASLP